MYVCTYVGMYVCMYVYTYVRTYVRTYVHMYVCVYVHICFRFVNEEKSLEIEIEPGMRDGQEYPFISEGTEAIGFIWSPYTLCSSRRTSH